MTDAERAVFAAELKRMEPWYKLMYQLNCRIPNAVKAGEFDKALSMLNLLRIVHPPFADIEGRAWFRRIEL